MNPALHDNIGATEKGVRFVLGGTMIMSLLINPALPLWLPLAAVYPVITAIINWDPFYAVLTSMFASAASNRYAPVHNPF